MSGGKGGSTTSSVQIPDWAQDAAKKNIAMGEYASQLGYMPYYGLDVAAQTPAQQAANQNFGSAVSAFGGQAPVDMNAGMPTAQTVDGVTGYSSGGLFDSALAELEQRRPAQYQAYSSMFVNPQTGEVGTAFTPSGSIGNTNLSDFTVRDGNIYSGGSSGDGMPVDSRSDLQKLYDMNAYLSKPKLEINSFGDLAGQVAKPFGIAEMIFDPLNRAATKYNRDYLMANSPQILGITQPYDAYQQSMSSGSSWNPSLTSGPDISYSSARDFSGTTGYNFNMD